MAQSKAFTTACWKVRDALAAIESTDFAIYSEQIIDTFRAAKAPKGYSVGDLFIELDTRPGRYDFTNAPSWFSKLRTVRNTPHAGTRLFATWSNS